MRFTVDRLDHLVITCHEVEITAAWYQRVLGMEREDFGSESRCALKFGGQKINVRPAGDLGWSSGRDAAPGSQDLHRHRGRAGQAHRRAGRDQLGLLPGPRWQPDRDRLLS